MLKTKILIAITIFIPILTIGLFTFNPKAEEISSSTITYSNSDTDYKKCINNLGSDCSTTELIYRSASENYNISESANKITDTTENFLLRFRNISKYRPTDTTTESQIKVHAIPKSKAEAEALLTLLQQEVNYNAKIQQLKTKENSQEQIQQYEELIKSNKKEFEERYEKFKIEFSWLVQ